MTLAGLYHRKGDYAAAAGALKKAIEKEQITWPNIYDGTPGTGLIAKQWNVFSWPTVYILDQEGVIRHKDLRDEEMEKAVNELLGKIQQ